MNKYLLNFITPNGRHSFVRSLMLPKTGSTLKLLKSSIKMQYTIFLYSLVLPEGVKESQRSLTSFKFCFLFINFFDELKLSCQEWKMTWQPQPMKL